MIAKERGPAIVKYGPAIRMSREMAEAHNLRAEVFGRLLFNPDYRVCCATMTNEHHLPDCVPVQVWNHE